MHVCALVSFLLVVVVCRPGNPALTSETRLLHSRKYVAQVPLHVLPSVGEYGFLPQTRVQNLSWGFIAVVGERLCVHRIERV